MPKDGRLEYAAYDPQNKFPGSHPSWEKLDKEQHWRILETVEKIAQTRGEWTGGEKGIWCDNL